MFRRVFSLFIALCLLSSLCLTVLAETWYLEEGSIDISVDQDANQYVKQGDSTPHKESSPTIITMKETTTETSNTISVSSSEGQTAQFTVKDVVIVTDQNTSGIDIKDGSTVEMTVSGTNTIDTIKEGSSDGNAATVHVGNADLTIQGDGNGNNVLNVNDNGTYHASQGAAIGSNGGEHFSGTITITGDVEVKGEGAYYGAGIGSGLGGDFNGELIVTDGASVNGDCAQNAAAIGAGEGGDFNGKVTVKDASVVATSYSNGAGIGAGYNGDFTGDVIIENSDVYARAGHISSSNGAGIGAGYCGDNDTHGDFTGNVIIKDSTVEAVALGRGAGIGSGGDGGKGFSTEFSGKVTIDNSDVTATSFGLGTSIGAPTENGVFSGSIEVTGDSNLTLADRLNKEMGDEALLGTNGTNTGTITIEDSAQVNAWSGEYDSNKVTGDRESYREALKSGSYTPVNTNNLDTIVGDGAEVNVVIVPKPAAPAKESTHARTVDTFWFDLEKQIMAAKKGDVITVDAKYRTSIPTRILELLTEYKVTLIIKWNGGDDITVKPDHGIESNAAAIQLTALQKQI